MQQQHSTFIWYGIVTTIVITITVQVFWNFRNFKMHKQQFVNEVQISLDNAVEAYYAAIAKDEKMMFISMDTSTEVNDSAALAKIKTLNFDSIFSTITTRMKSSADTIIIDTYTNNFNEFQSKKITQFHQRIDIPQLLKFKDSVRMFNEISSLYISISEDSLDFDKLKTFLDTELERKEMDLPYRLYKYRGDTVIGEIPNETMPDDFLRTNSKSAYLRSDERLELQFANASQAALQNSSGGILLSSLLTLAIISSLWYLLRVIRRQKQLAEIKNDLISNITHEFKTPIATIATALEAIQHFGVLKDSEKTKKYVAMSDVQLQKLHLMVEKLLETATLDSESLLLKKEVVNLIDFSQRITTKLHSLQSEKSIKFHSTIEEVLYEIDPFHFENVLTNLLDNALKYGGDQIAVDIRKDVREITISVSDNGKPIDKMQRERIFDKFYRIPKGNTHDVKGFGIGLYYAKKIIEKHGGQLLLVPDASHTIFKITFPL